MINEFVVHPVDPGVRARLSQESCPISGKVLEAFFGVLMNLCLRPGHPPSGVRLTVAWSRVRYLDYSFLRVDVEPAPKGRYARLRVSGIAETGDRIDHFTVARRAK